MEILRGARLHLSKWLMCVLNIYEAVNLTEDITRANGNLIAISRIVRKGRVDGQYLSVWSGPSGLSRSGGEVPMLFCLII